MNPDLANYITEGLKSGAAPGQIQEELVRAGWPIADVAAALAAIPAPAPATSSVTHPRDAVGMVLRIFFVLTLLAALSLAGYLYYRDGQVRTAILNAVPSPEVAATATALPSVTP